jgi:hypothetical protein
MKTHTKQIVLHTEVWTQVSRTMGTGHNKARNGFLNNGLQWMRGGRFLVAVIWHILLSWCMCFCDWASLCLVIWNRKNSGDKANYMRKRQMMLRGDIHFHFELFWSGYSSWKLQFNYLKKKKLVEEYQKTLNMWYDSVNMKMLSFLHISRPMLNYVCPMCVWT